MASSPKLLQDHPLNALCRHVGLLYVQVLTIPPSTTVSLPPPESLSKQRRHLNLELIVKKKKTH